INYVNEIIIYLGRNAISLINNGMLADVDNQFYLNNFYESNLNLVDTFNDD
ncbi:hypothetical protein YYE_05001, partial [Plasmodium vinckei vinckei]